MSKKILFLFLPLFFLLFIRCDKSTNPADENPQPPGYQEDIPWPSLDENPWPIHHGSAQFTGRSKYLGPTEGRVEWKIRIPTFQVNDDTYLSPIVGKDSTFYFISFQDTSYPHSFLHAFDFNGNEKWKFSLPYDGDPFSKTTAPPIITSDGKLYAADWSRNLYSISIEGEIIWRNKLSAAILGRMNVGKEGTLYYLDASGTLFSVSESGNTNWSLKLSEFGSRWSTVAISPDGNTLYVVSSDLFAVTKEGKLKWTFDTYIDVASNHTPLIDSEGNIYISTFQADTAHSGFLSIKPDGTLRYKKVINTYIDPTIDKEGNIYVGTGLDLISWDYDGKFRWSKPFPLSSGASSLVSDINGNIFFITDDKLLSKVDKNGNLVWQLEVDGKSFESPAISKEGNLFFGTVFGSDRYYYNIK